MVNLIYLFIMAIGKDTLSYAGPIAEGLGIMTGSKELRGLGKIAKAFGDVDQHKQTRKDIKTHSNASKGATTINAFHSETTKSVKDGGSINDV